MRVRGDDGVDRKSFKGTSLPFMCEKGIDGAVIKRRHIPLSQFYGNISIVRKLKIIHIPARNLGQIYFCISPYKIPGLKILMF